MIDDVEVYFARGCGRCERFATADCATRRWSDGLHALRQICRDAGLAETAKWGHPCYMHAGRNIAILGALRDSFWLGFFDAALLKDPAGVLERQGPNSRHADTLRFTAASQVAERAAVVRAYLQEAMGYAEAGIRPSREPQAVELPDALVEAMDADPALAEAFLRLTPGRQRSYVIQLASAKTEATRVARILRFRARILAGKGALER